MPVIHPDIKVQAKPEVTPDGGTYDKHIQPFGTIPQKMTLGGKYKFVPDSNPPPGLYDPSDS